MIVSILFGVSFENVDATILLVGSSRTYKIPASVASMVKDGDTVQIDTGTYANQATTWSANNLTIRGTARFAHLTPPVSISNGKAIWVVQGKNILIENIEFSDATVPDQNGAGIRIEGGNITIRNCYFHNNEDGILGGDGSGCNVTIENCEFANNGYGDGYSHNLYIGHAASLTFKFNYTHHAKIGHTLKSRAQVNYILYNRIMDEADGTASYEVDLPNGGTSCLIGNVIQQGPATDNPTIICYGEEGLTNSGKDLYIVNNTIVNDRSGGTFLSIASSASRAKVVNNLFVGKGTVISGPADTLTNLVTDAPEFKNKVAYDYQPTSKTPGINIGSDPGSVNGYVLIPSFMYKYNCDGISRVSQGIIDIGAYEYSATKIETHKSPLNVIHRDRNSHNQVNLLGRTVESKNKKQFKGVNFPFIY